MELGSLLEASIALDNNKSTDDQNANLTLEDRNESQKATTDQPESSETESVNESPQQSEKPEQASPGNTAWYIAHVYSGFEKKVSDLIREQARHKGVEDAFEEILNPTQDVVELRRGKRMNLEKKVFPGYVLLKMRMDDETWHLVNNTAKVTGFLGGGNGMAAPISQDEVNQILNQTKIGKEKSKPLVTFEVGEQVRVCDGPFNSFNGFVEEVDEEKSRLKVSVSIFGRATPVELEYSLVEKG